MISHVFIGITDFERGYNFYAPLMEILGYPQRFFDPTKPWAAWMTGKTPRPLFVIGHPYDGGEATPGHGQMVALLAPDRATVDAAYHMALEQGGRCEGPPGLRPHYHPNYYGAYFRDPDGNKLCVVCHDAPEAGQA